MVGGTLYLAGKDAATGQVLYDAQSCAMCRRMIINAGLKNVVTRLSPTSFRVVEVQDWVEEDDSLPAEQGDENIPW